MENGSNALVSFSFFTNKLCVPEAPLNVEGISCPQGWPQRGEITFQDYHMKYRDNMPIILNGINLTIHSQEVVGIVGRTGSGELGILAASCPCLLVQD